MTIPRSGAAAPVRSRGRHGWALLALGACALLLAGCGEISILRPAGPIGEGNRQILLNSLAVMLVIVVPTMIATLAFAWWFRAGNPKAKYRPEFTYSGRIEVIVWSIPILTILFIGGLIWYGSHELDPFKPLDSDEPTLEVQVVSLDWKWLFIYPEAQVASVNELVIPVGRPVRFRITSASVMNTFFIPNLGSMIYAMNGMETKLYLQADREGTFYGQSAHYSGDGFSGMNFDVRAVPEAEFSAWAVGLKAAGPVLNVETYRELSRQSRDVLPYTYSHVQGGLFESVVDQTLPPGPGPESGRGGAEEIHPESSPEASAEQPAPAAAPASASAHGAHHEG
ncbi:ubiquinol oxidase subunit II [Antarcticirhabdus aurantiaca]|uniref:Ubiquinol oxidase subunit II n=1 Tax=Antarcticirhabdus aurantiaca TaxID=2606717 RepID=A0ACD4NQU3_9HYPH|nr:ubiquinol oxidase subunit II [Antarcticirhabdus aurantiaca]WAJ29096.1 ubiquinol oxidase subunit II [Jeongeuplla avenae]